MRWQSALANGWNARVAISRVKEAARGNAIAQQEVFSRWKNRCWIFAMFRRRERTLRDPAGVN